MAYEIINGTSIVDLFQNVNTVTNGLGIPMLVGISIFPAFFMLYKISEGSARKALAGSLMICAILSLMLFGANLMPIYWTFIYIVLTAVAFAFPF